MEGYEADSRQRPHSAESRRSDHARSTTAEHVEAIRSFLAMVDPVTGYIEDEPDDDGKDETPED